MLSRERRSLEILLVKKEAKLSASDLYKPKKRNSRGQLLTSGRKMQGRSFGPVPAIRPFGREWDWEVCVAAKRSEVVCDMSPLYGIQADCMP